MRIGGLICLLILPATLLAMSCNNGAGIVYMGDSLQTVLQQCGEPSAQKKQLQVLDTAQTWVYDIPHAYDPGFTRMTVYFRNDKVSNIHILEHYVVPICRQGLVQVGTVMTTQTTCGDWDYTTLYTSLCRYGFGLGDTTETVAARCGNPTQMSDLKNNSIETLILQYTNQGANDVLTIENGKLKAIQ